MPGEAPGELLQRVSVEAQLEHMARLGLRSGELGVVGLVVRVAVGRCRDPYQEVGDASHAVMHHRELIDDVPAVSHRVADSSYPAIEGLVLTTIRCPIDAEPLVLELGQTCNLVVEALAHQQLRERSWMVEFGLSITAL